MMMTSSCSEYKVRGARCSVDGTARNRQQLSAEMGLCHSVTGGLPPHLVPNLFHVLLVHHCVQGSQISAADLVLRPHGVLPNTNRGLLTHDGRFSWQCVCGHSRQITS